MITFFFFHFALESTLLIAFFSVFIVDLPAYRLDITLPESRLVYIHFYPFFHRLYNCSTQIFKNVEDFLDHLFHFRYLQNSLPLLKYLCGFRQIAVFCHHRTGLVFIVIKLRFCRLIPALGGLRGVMLMIVGNEIVGYPPSLF